jgi:hypothetical protein
MSSCWRSRSGPRCANERCSNPVINPRKKFCSWDCYNRFHVALSKKKARALERLRQGETVKAVAKRYRLTHTLVRQWRSEKPYSKRGRRGKAR